MMVIKHRSTSFLDTSPALDGITEILTILTIQPIHFSQICRVSKIRLRSAVLRYLNICKEKEFVIGIETSLKIRDGRGISRQLKPITVYHVTEKGKLFMELVK